MNWVRAVLGPEVKVDAAPIGMDRFQHEVYTPMPKSYRFDRMDTEDWAVGG